MIVEDGRLHFSSKAHLKQKYKELKESDGQSGILEMSTLTKEGFYSLRPLLRAEDTDIVYSYLNNQQSNLRNADDQEGEEELISDDYFAFYLNQSSEIQVSDSVYIYTPTGLYFVHENDIEHLYNYLKTSSSNGRIAPCGGGDPELRAIDSKITQFVVDCNDDPSLPPLNPPTPPSPQPSQEDKIRNFIGTLTPCNQHDGWLNNILGTSAICEEKFSDNHKLKTKFWNQDYFFLASIGVSVKSQKKTLGIWFNKKIDVIGMGVYSAQFDLEIPMPDYPNIPTTYVYNGYAYDKDGKMKGAAAPAFPFKSPIEIYVQLPIKSLDLEYSEEELNKLFWGQVWDNTKSALKNLDPPDKKNVTFIGFLPDKVHVLHSFMEKSENNDGKITHYYDWNFVISLTSGLDKLSPSVNKIGKLYSYSGAKINMYGYGKDGYTQKGSRLIVEE